jgi:hypothetical protein
LIDLWKHNGLQVDDPDYGGTRHHRGSERQPAAGNRQPNDSGERDTGEDTGPGYIP